MIKYYTFTCAHGMHVFAILYTNDFATGLSRDYAIGNPKDHGEIGFQIKNAIANIKRKRNWTYELRQMCLKEKTALEHIKMKCTDVKIVLINSFNMGEYIN